MKNLTKGIAVNIKENSIFKLMGRNVVTGTFFNYNGDASGFAFNCIETGAIECCDFNDGLIEFSKPVDTVLKHVKPPSIKIDSQFTEFFKGEFDKTTFTYYVAHTAHDYFTRLRACIPAYMGYYGEDDLTAGGGIWVDLKRWCNSASGTDYSAIQATLSTEFREVDFENLRFNYDCGSDICLDQFYPDFTLNNMTEEIKAVFRDVEKIKSVLGEYEVTPPTRLSVRKK
jgi:hypothetical protein